MQLLAIDPPPHPTPPPQVKIIGLKDGIDTGPTSDSISAMDRKKKVRFLNQ